MAKRIAIESINITIPTDQLPLAATALTGRHITDPEAAATVIRETFTPLGLTDWHYTPTIGSSITAWCGDVNEDHVDYDQVCATLARIAPHLHKDSKMVYWQLNGHGVLAIHNGELRRYEANLVPVGDGTPITPDDTW